MRDLTHNDSEELQVLPVIVETTHPSQIDVDMDLPIISPEIEEDASLNEQVAIQMESIAHDDHLDNMDYNLESIQSHEWKDGVLFFSVLWQSGHKTNVTYDTLKRDFPLATAQYILSTKIGSVNGKYVSGSYARWARTFLKQLNNCLRRYVRLQYNYKDHLSDHIDSQTTISLPDNNTYGTGVIRRVAVS